MVDSKVRLGVTGSQIGDLGGNGALAPILTQLGGAKGGQMAMDYARQMYPDAPEANPWEAALQFFLEMGRGASQPGATVLGSAVGAMQAPVDYLNAKKKEKTETDRARMQTALQLAPSLKPKVGTYKDPKEYSISMPIKDADGKITGYETAYTDYLTAKQFDELKNQGARFTSVDKTSKDSTRMDVILKGVADDPNTPVNESITSIPRNSFDPNLHLPTSALPKDPSSSTFKERKFFKTGFDPVVVKNQTDAAQFEKQGWAAVPPEGWTDSKGETAEDAAEVQSSKILDSGVVIYAFKNGTRKVVDGLGNEVTGEAAQRAITEAEERGIELQGERSGARRAGTVGVDTALAAFEKVGEIRTNIANLEEAKRLLTPEDQGGGGANSGQLADLLPNWKASTIALENVKNRLGLDVVGSVTFGALSESELNMALNTALPTNMPEKQLIGWLQEKIDAQNKLMAYLNEQAIFLSDGDKTIGDWLRKKKADQEESRRIDANRRKIKNNFNFSVMPIQQLREIDTDSLTDAEFDAWDKRMTELGF